MPHSRKTRTLEIAKLLRLMYWTMRKDPSTTPHLLGTLIRVLPNYLRLRLWLRAGGATALAIIKVEHIGDIVSAEPISRYARQSNPNKRILWVAGKQYSELINTFTSVDHVFSVRCCTDWILLSILIRPLEVWNLHIGGHSCPRCQVPIE